jgi:hypothetical protein
MRRLLLVVAAVALVSSCSAPECSEEFHLCRGECVLEGEETASKCGVGDLCISCPDLKLPHAAPACLGHQPSGAAICGIACFYPWRDCNHVESDGCETSLLDPQNCGGCGVVCSSGTCTQSGCAPG